MVEGEGDGDNFEDLPYGAEGSKSASTRSDGTGGGDEETLTPTSPIPPDVEIPIETIYGDNRPIPGAAEKEARRSAQSQNQNQSQKTNSTNQPSNTNNDSPQNSRQEDLKTQTPKVIRINALAALIALAIIAASAFFVGKLINQQLDQKAQMADNSKDPTSTNDNEGKAQNPSATTATKPSNTGSNSTSSTANAERPKTRSGFIRDLGTYDRSKSYTDLDMAEARCDLAKQKIIWFTSNPENPGILKILTKIKRERGVSVFIVCGSDTELKKLEIAQDTGLPVYRIKTQLDNPYSLLIIDSRIILDISRQRWIWESSEPKIVQETILWAEEFISTADILQ